MVSPELVVVLVIAIFSLLLISFWIWMLIDCITKESDQGNDKVTWVIVIALLGWIGALIYLLARRPTRVRQFGR
ncbi:MAG: PLDc_N domain-containing protein [Akkermansiaceae bacterium]|jgi:hypothetical protein|nr:PLDc_N domain-containing protein [Akkermansiaceae bacterium]